MPGAEQQKEDKIKIKIKIYRHEMASLHTQGQPHDRILSPSGNGALDMPAEPNLIGKPVEVTTSITQKMLSATTGSLLTSLLGM